MQLAGKYKLVRINKGAGILLLMDIQEIKLPCRENKKYSLRIFFIPSNPQNLQKRQVFTAPHSALR